MRYSLDDYVTVHERIEKFYAKYPTGRLTTTILEHNAETGFILIRAEAYRDADDALPAATGHAYELRSAGHVQASSYVEVCETSAIGRALALLGFEVRRGVASREEMEKATRAQADRAAASAPAPATRTRPKPAEDAPPATTPPPAKATANAPHAARAADLSAEILESAGALGYDAAKVRKWVNQKYEVTGGLDSLTEQDKYEVLRIFREKAPAAARARGTAQK
jgi:pyruvate/2-oxoglutarate dehydrogenase complex dihydrolipoamide acyltransferase (E2) component